MKRQRGTCQDPRQPFRVVGHDSARPAAASTAAAARRLHLDVLLPRDLLLAIVHDDGRFLSGQTCCTQRLNSVLEARRKRKNKGRTELVSHVGLREDRHRVRLQPLLHHPKVHLRPDNIERTG